MPMVRNIITIVTWPGIDGIFNRLGSRSIGARSVGFSKSVTTSDESHSLPDCFDYNCILEKSLIFESLHLSFIFILAKVSLISGTLSFGSGLLIGPSGFT